MSDDKIIGNKKHLYDDSIVFDETHLPDELKEYIKELKKYDEVKDWLGYDLKFDEFEFFIPFILSLLYRSPVQKLLPPCSK